MFYPFYVYKRLKECVHMSNTKSYVLECVADLYIDTHRVLFLFFTHGFSLSSHMFTYGFFSFLHMRIFPFLLSSLFPSVCSHCWSSLFASAINSTDFFAINHSFVRSPSVRLFELVTQSGWISCQEDPLTILFLEFVELIASNLDFQLIQS